MLSTEDWRWHLPSPEALRARCGVPLTSDPVRNGDPMDVARCAECAHAPETTVLMGTVADTALVAGVGMPPPAAAKPGTVPTVSGHPVTWVGRRHASEAT
ncbi:MAG: hypothetical protein ACRDQ4_25625 [Pseudonocardiaceae bacterium]